MHSGDITHAPHTCKTKKQTKKMHRVELYFVITCEGIIVPIIILILIPIMHNDHILVCHTRIILYEYNTYYQYN